VWGERTVWKGYESILEILVPFGTLTSCQLAGAYGASGRAGVGEYIELVGAVVEGFFFVAPYHTLLAKPRTMGTG